MADAVALPSPCWWIDRDDCWETTHHPTREEAVSHHTDQVRCDHGWPLSDLGAAEIMHGVPVQEERRCHELTCPECEMVVHVQERDDRCGWCEADIETEQIAPEDPDQPELFAAASSMDGGQD